MISKFINSMRKNLDSKDESVILDWLLFSNDLSKGLESSLTIQLIDTMDALDFVKSNFSEETYQSSWTYVGNCGIVLLHRKVAIKLGGINYDYRQKRSRKSRRHNMPSSENNYRCKR